jgi:beta-glucosidase
MPRPKLIPVKEPFAKDFLWGAATSAHQVEGHQHNNWSVWEASVADKLAKNARSRLINTVPDWKAIQAEAEDPVNYISGSAADHYNRYEEDFDLLKSLGCNAYRFSIEWSRVETKPNQYNKAALTHYRNMVQALKKRGITPMVTLHHFADPIWLEDKGGWHGPAVVESFTAFARAISKQIGQDIDYWCTVNEPGSYLLQRYLGGGAWPAWPTTVMNPSLGYKYLKNVISAHKSVRKVIKEANPKAMVGIAHGLLDYQLGRHDPLSWIFKKQLDYIPDTYILNRIRNDTDFIGVNYYMRLLIKSRLSSPQYWTIKKAHDDPANDMGWGIYPAGLYNITQKLIRYNLPLIVTENGIPDTKDNLRGKYINDHLAELARSISDGADIRGYFYWSLLDNYEWSEGFWPKFGLVSIDRKTKNRTLRQSALEYASLIKKYSA